MKDINLDEKDKNVKKMLEANKQLREDMKREAERYHLLEKKYKDLLIKYNMLAKENAHHMETLFHMNTGGNINNYESYLHHNEDNIGKSSKGFQQNQSSTKRRQESEGKNKKGTNASFDRTFEDVF
jgi:hypothetical protein